MKHHLLALLVLSLAACAPRKGYDGPELPPERIAVIKNSLEYLSPGSTIATYDLSSRGIALLPGTYDVELHFVTEAGPRETDCEYSSSFDSSGFLTCCHNNKGSCDSAYYYSVQKECTFDTRDVHCAGNLTLVAGEEYQVNDTGLFNLPLVIVQKLDRQNSSFWGKAYLPDGEEIHCELGELHPNARSATTHAGSSAYSMAEYGLGTPMPQSCPYEEYRKAK